MSFSSTPLSLSDLSTASMAPAAFSRASFTDFSSDDTPSVRRARSGPPDASPVPVTLMPWAWPPPGSTWTVSLVVQARARTSVASPTMANSPNRLFILLPPVPACFPKCEEESRPRRVPPLGAPPAHRQEEGHQEGSGGSALEAAKDPATGVRAAFRFRRGRRLRSWGGRLLTRRRRRSRLGGARPPRGGPGPPTPPR